MTSARLQTADWQEVATGASQRPDLPRSGHCSAPLPPEHDADVIVFGGYTETPDKQRQASNDTWVYKSGSGWSRMQTTGGPPRVRLAAAAAQVGNLFYVIGGWDPGFKRDGGEILSDIWALDVKTAEWTEVLLNPEGEHLESCSRHQAVAIGGTIYIHTHRTVNTILALDTAAEGAPKLSTLKLETPKGAPISRGLHSLTAVHDSLYIFGGALKSGPMLNDLWRIDLEHSRVVQLRPTGPEPHVRCSHTAVAVGSEIVCHGGSYYREDGTGLQPMDDTFVLDTDACEWRNLAVSSQQPAARNAATLDPAGRNIILYGGWDPFVETYNDTWRLQL